jgi:Secretion system C-terminal sorting domain
MYPKHQIIMRKLFILPLILLSVLSLNVTAQSGIGNNSVSVATNTNGDISWNANVDGHNRRGYIDSKNSKEECNSELADEDILTPTTISLYGNSFTDVLFFSGNGKDLHTITILDEEGKVLIADQYTNDHSIDVSSFASGTYLIEINRGMNRRSYTKKFIKE